MAGFDAEITSCCTPDLERTADFYEGVMELPLVLDQGLCRIYRAAKDACLGFCRREGTPRPEGVIFTLVTEDVDGWHRRLTAQHVPCERGPVYNSTYQISKPSTATPPATSSRSNASKIPAGPAGCPRNDSGRGSESDRH